MKQSGILYSDTDLETLILGEEMKPTAQFIAEKKQLEAEVFALEAPTPGEIPERVLEELMTAKETAHDLQQAFSDACKVQGEKYKVNVAALKEYITARVGDKLEAAKAKASAVMDLIG